MGDGSESRRHALDSIAVRHPHNRGAALPDAFEEVTGIIDREFGAAIFPVFGLGHIAPGEMRDELHAIADTEDRDALIEECFLDGWRLLFVHAGRPAGKDDPLRTIG